MEFKEGVPIYLQLTQEIAHKIMAGYYLPGQRIESVRELALIYGVNPNTVQKSLVLAEQQGLVYAQGSEGRFVTDNRDLISSLKKDTIAEEVEAFVQKMKAFGYDKAAIIAQLTKGEHDDNN